MSKQIIKNRTLELGKGTIRDVQYENCTLTKCNGTIFKSCTFKECNLQSLNYVTMTACDLDFKSLHSITNSVRS